MSLGARKRRPGARRSARNLARRPRESRRAAGDSGGTGAPSAALPPDWRPFVGRWLESAGCRVREAARGDWEVELSPDLQTRWRRKRVRLVFDPLRATLPRGAWFTAPGSGAGRKILDAALEHPVVTRRTALAHVPGAPENGLDGIVHVRNLSWGPSRLGPVRYERRVACHAVVTRWGGLPRQEPWVLLLGPDGELIEWVQSAGLPDINAREGLYQLRDELSPEVRADWMKRARLTLELLLDEREGEWERAVARLRDDELNRLGSFFSSRIEEEEERLRRRTGNSDESEVGQGDATSLKLEWERRAAEVRHRWALRTEVRWWGIEEWSWPVADLEQEVRAGAVHMRLTSRVDVARGKPALPDCPSCGAPAELLVRARGSIVCERCG